jgi:glycosyltransferase involved in cell wall biosynthesis
MLEAMSKGLAIVSFDCPTGPREVIDDGVDGLLVPNGDGAALAEALAALMDDEALRRRLGSAAVRKAEAFSLDAVGERWEALVARLTAGG